MDDWGFDIKPSASGVNQGAIQKPSKTASIQPLTPEAIKDKIFTPPNDTVYVKGNEYMQNLFKVLQQQLSTSASLGAQGFSEVFLDISNAALNDPDMITVMTEDALKLYFNAVQSMVGIQVEASKVFLGSNLNVEQMQLAKEFDDFLTSAAGDSDENIDDLPF